MDDDDGGFFDGGDDGGSDGSDDGDDNGGYTDDGQDDGDADQDAGDQDGADQDSGDAAADGGADGGGDDGGDGGDNNGDNGDLNDSFSDPNDLIGLDDDTAISADSFPNATATDFEDDGGAWTAEDYQQSARNLFGDQEFFGDTMATQRADEGYTAFGDPGFAERFEQIAPGSSQTVQLFERDGQLHAFGFLTQAMLEFLMLQYTGIDFSNVDVSVPPRGEPVPPQPLPPAFASVPVQDAVDLRKYCTPVGDQGQTSRCAAFAWTHAAELVANMKNGSTPRLSPSFTMLEFQRMQGDAQDYAYAHSGGDGTVNGPDAGRVLAEAGTCRQELWPDESETPVTFGAGPDRRCGAASPGRHAASHRARGCPHGAERGLPGAGGHEHRSRVFQCRARWPLQRRGTSQRPARTPRHADRRLHGEFLHSQEFLGRKTGATRATATFPKACWRNPIPSSSRRW